MATKGFEVGSSRRGSAGRGNPGQENVFSVIAGSPKNGAGRLGVTRIGKQTRDFFEQRRIEYPAKELVVLAPGLIIAELRLTIDQLIQSGHHLAGVAGANHLAQGARDVV